MRSVRGLIEEATWGRMVLRRGPRSASRIAITFDGGPHELTPRYLDVLDQLGIAATFFVVGKRADARPELVRDYLRRGHQIASQGYDEVPFTELSPRDLLAACRRTELATGGQLTGRPWVRPPDGALDARSMLALRAAGYTVSLWSIDSHDADDLDPRSIAARCATAGAGDVLRFHEGQPHTAEALPLVVRPLLDAGYECVTMHDLFAG